MKKLYLCAWALFAVLGSLSSCDFRSTTTEDNYYEVIGEHEQAAPDAGYRLNLSYNGPISMRDKFQHWADSLQQKHPSMVKTSENIFMNYMPEQMGPKINRNMFQVGVSYNLTVADSAAYNQITRDALKHNFPFNVNVSGTFLDPTKKAAVQKELMQKAVANAKAKLDFLKGDDGRSFEIIGIEELDTNLPYGPEYYDFNRRMVSRVKVKARLQ